MNKLGVTYGRKTLTPIPARKKAGDLKFLEQVKFLPEFESLWEERTLGAGGVPKQRVTLAKAILLHGWCKALIVKTACLRSVRGPDYFQG